jgi:excisionase family DNA binding protein
MAQTRTKPRKPGRRASANANGPVAPLPEVLALPEAAVYLRVTEAELLRLVDDQALPGRPFGREWRFLKSAIQDWLKTPPKPGSREAVLSTIGSMKGDPYLEGEVKEIYRKRRENLVEDIQ